MKKYSIKRIIHWAVLNGAMVTIGYLGIYKGMIGFERVFKFLIWVNFISMVLIRYNNEAREAMLKRGASIPSSINNIYGIIFSCTLIYFGYILYGIIDLLATMFQISIYSDSDKPKEKPLQSGNHKNGINNPPKSPRPDVKPVATGIRVTEGNTKSHIKPETTEPKPPPPPPQAENKSYKLV